MTVAINSLCEELQSDAYQHDLDRIGESPLFDANLRGTYVGETNRIIK